MRDYSRKQLTFWEDRLSAIVGISSELHKIWKYEHLAGAWRDLSIKQIAWHKVWRHEGPLARLPPPRIRNIPSWSWASFPGDVDFKTILTEDAKLGDYSIKLSNPVAPFGRVEAGVISLRAVLVEVEDDDFLRFCDFD